MSMRTFPQRYLIAQYASDTRRMETRNIGVIVWAAGRAEALFLADDDASSIVSDMQNYRRWVNHWNRLVYKGPVYLPRSEPIEKSDERFLDALLRTQQGNYLLFDAGEVTDALNGNNVSQAAKFLFEQLVSFRQPIDEVIETDNLKSLADRAFVDAGIGEREDFQTSYSIQCNVFDVPEELVFNYAIADDSPLAVFQRVQMKQQSVTSAALMFHSLAQSRQVKGKNKCVALVDVEDEQTPHVVRYERMLKKVAKVLNIRDQKTVDELRRMVA